jgi:hypothetical protein
MWKIGKKMVESVVVKEQQLKLNPKGKDQALLESPQGKDQILEEGLDTTHRFGGLREGFPHRERGTKPTLTLHLVSLCYEGGRGLYKGTHDLGYFRYKSKELRGLHGLRPTKVNIVLTKEEGISRLLL